MNADRATMIKNTKPKKYNFLDFFDLDEIQRIQDLFSKSTGVASIITTPNGTPITKQSGFSCFCKAVRQTEQGLKNCMLSDALIGSPKSNGPRIQRCMSGGLFDGGASIMAGSQHIGNWLIGQIIEDDYPKEDILNYAKKIGITDPNLDKSIEEITHMTLDQFADICNFLYFNAQLLSKLALNNLLQKEEIDNRILIEKNLEQEKEQFKVTIASIGDGVITTDKAGNITFMNKEAEEITGWTINEVVGNSIEDILPLKDEFTGIKVNNPVRGVLKLKKTIPLANNVVFICRDGREKQIVDSAAPIKASNGEILGAVLVIRDATEDRKYQREIENRDLKHSAMISKISDVIGILDENVVIKYKSPNVTKWFGWLPEELVGENAFKMVHPDDESFIRAELEDLFKKSGLTKSFEYRYLCKDGSYKYVNSTATNLINDKNINGILLNYKDISMRVKLEEEKKSTEALLRNQQKLESIGTLAGGVAHEINNPINGIMNYSQLILDSDNRENEAPEYASEIIHETKRVAEIVKNLLQFSRQEKQHFSKARIDDILNQTLSLINTIIKHDQIDMHIIIPKNLPEVQCRSQQIQQVIMNILTNSRDALNIRYDGYHENKKLIITCNLILKEEKNYIRIIFEDHGTGIPIDVQDKVFDPFFTTKSRDEGTGLGLAISYSIIKEHEGELTFETIEGEYTKFFVDLPVDN
jgi:PAS domain S-box-containing protein